MAIPASQLETWSHQGSITQSSATYNTIKGVLEAPGTPYYSKSFEVFLQGSYGNDTNIYAESDVDIVVRLDSTFEKDLSRLTVPEQATYEADRTPASYHYADFKRDVLKVLTAKYGGDVKTGDKAIAIAANGGRRKADVIVATEFRKYLRYVSSYDQRYVSGVCIYNSAGQRIVNYPKKHSENLTTKHKDTYEWFKPLVRIVKNMRGKMVEKKLIAGGSAPSYYLEGLLYNVPKEHFGTSYGDSFRNAINWIHKADRSKFLCANEAYVLLYEGSLVTWRAAQCDAFVAGAIKLWNEW